MACSKEYMDLVKTASGYTPEHPWEPMLGVDFASSFDAIEWENTAERLRDQAFRKLYELGDVETALAGSKKKGEQIYPRYEAMRALYDPLNAKVHEYQRIFDPINFSGLFNDDWAKGNKAMVGDIATTCVDLACLLEQIDGEIRLYGVTPTTVTPSVTGGKGKTDTGGSGGMGILGTIATLGVAGGLVYLAIVLSRRSDQKSMEKAA